MIINYSDSIKLKRSLTWFGPRHVFWFNCNTTNTHKVPPGTLKALQLLRWNKSVRVHAWFSARQLDDGMRVHFHGNRSIPNPHPLVLGDCEKWKMSSLLRRKGKINQKVTYGCPVNEQFWWCQWSCSAALLLQRKALVLFCASQRQYRERLTRQSTLNGRATKHHVQNRIGTVIHTSLQVSRPVTVKLKDLKYGIKESSTY